MTQPRDADEGLNPINCSPAFLGGHMAITGFDSTSAFLKADLAYDVDAIAKRLDEKDPRWSLYRTHDQRWGVQIRNERETETFCGEHLATVLQQAFEWKFLELAPRQPEVMTEADFRVVRPNDREWELQFRGRYYSRFKTKKEAQQSIEKRVAISKREFDGWESQFGWTKEKIEGVDFRWSTKSYCLGMTRQSF
jgi:hypothetical protein